MSRADRRLPGDFREIKVSRGEILTSQGSSRVRYGETDVICSVDGPRECRRRSIELRWLDVNVRTYPEMNPINQMVATAVKNALDCDAYPDSAVTISLTIVCDNGSLPCCAINAALIALRDAGLKFKEDVAASAFVIRDGTILVDPSKQEEQTADGVATFVFRKNSGEVFSCFFEGMVKPEVMVALVERAKVVPEALLL